jgi:hypothetical protein
MPQLHLVLETLTCLARLIRGRLTVGTGEPADQAPHVRMLNLFLGVWGRFPSDGMTVDLGKDGLLGLLAAPGDPRSRATIAVVLVNQLAGVFRAPGADENIAVASLEVRAGVITTEAALDHLLQRRGARVDMSADQGLCIARDERPPVRAPQPSHR